MGRASRLMWSRLTREHRYHLYNGSYELIASARGACSVKTGREHLKPRDSWLHVKISGSMVLVKTNLPNIRPLSDPSAAPTPRTGTAYCVSWLQPLCEGESAHMLTT